MWRKRCNGLVPDKKICIINRIYYSIRALTPIAGFRFVWYGPFERAIGSEKGGRSGWCMVGPSPAVQGRGFRNADESAYIGPVPRIPAQCGDIPRPPLYPLDCLLRTPRLQVKNGWQAPLLAKELTIGEP